MKPEMRYSKDTTTYDSYKNKIKKRVDAGSAALPRPRAQRGASVRVASTLLSHDRVVIAQHNPGESPSPARYAVTSRWRRYGWGPRSGTSRASRHSRLVDEVRGCIGKGAAWSASIAGMSVIVCHTSPSSETCFPSSAAAAAVLRPWQRVRATRATRQRPRP